ncbi:MAG: FlgD immunoglobulin-like domain containing protein [bacterium]
MRRKVRMTSLVVFFLALSLSKVAASPTATFAIIVTTVENTSPKANIIRPKNGAKVSGKTVIIEATSLDSDIASIKYQYRQKNRKLWTDIISSTNPTSMFSLTWDTTNLPSGSYDLRAVARDNANNEDEEPLTITLIIEHNNFDYAEDEVEKDKDNLIEGGNGTKIKIPDGALNSKTIIRVSRPDWHSLPSLRENPTGLYLEVTLESKQNLLNKPATISLPYQDKDSNGLVDGTRILEANLKLCRWDGNNWVELPTTIDPVKNMATAITNHFTIFGLFGGIDTIFGKATGTDGVGLKGVKIEVLKGGGVEKSILTEANGNYLISGLTGIYGVRAYQEDFVTQIKDNITPGTEVNFILIPSRFKTYIYPNPFKMNKEDLCTIKFHLPQAEKVAIKIYDLTGGLIRELIDENYAPGTYQVRWDGKNDHGDKVASGVYLYLIKAGSKVKVKKIAVIKYAQGVKMKNKVTPKLHPDFMRIIKVKAICPFFIKRNKSRCP